MWWEDQLYPIQCCQPNLLPTFTAVQTSTTPSLYKILTSTPFEGIRTLQDHMNRYIENLPQIWYPKWHFVIKDIHHKHNLLEMSVTVQHHINFQVKPSISITCYRNNPLKCQRVSSWSLLHFQLATDLNSAIRCECLKIQAWLGKINLLKLCLVVGRSFEIGIQFTWMFLF
jgi:hypothetical protein